MRLRLRHAEFAHILDQSRKRDRQPDAPSSPDSVELFDAIDSMPLREADDVVALLLIAQAPGSLEFSGARQCAAELGQDGIILLHRTPGLHDLLMCGLDRLKDEVGAVTWTDGAG